MSIFQPSLFTPHTPSSGKKKNKKPTSFHNRLDYTGLAKSSTNTTLLPAGNVYRHGAVTDGKPLFYKGTFGALGPVFRKNASNDAAVDNNLTPSTLVAKNYYCGKCDDARLAEILASNKIMTMDLCLNGADSDYNYQYYDDDDDNDDDADAEKGKAILGMNIFINDEASGDKKADFVDIARAFRRRRKVPMCAFRASRRLSLPCIDAAKALRVKSSRYDACNAVVADADDDAALEGAGVKNKYMEKLMLGNAAAAARPDILKADPASHEEAVNWVEIGGVRGEADIDFCAWAYGFY